jgi:pimeloyl-ACP methyl ester carboxylesterase
MALRMLRSGALIFTADELGDGPLVLCLHGFPDHRGSWRHQLPALAEAGYHVIAPDLRGYEPSSQPEDGDYHLARLGEDVTCWLDDLGEQRVHLVGHDWGAAIATVAANLIPDRVASLTTVAVPPLRRMGAMVRARPAALTRLWYMAFFQLRAGPERALLTRDGAFVRRLWADWSPGWTCPEPAMRALLDTLGRPGVASAALAYYRHLPDLFTETGRRSWRLLRDRVKVPTLAMTGALDGCMDSSLYDVGVSEEDFEAGVTVRRLEDAGHFPHQERPDDFNRLLIDWLAQHA